MTFHYFQNLEENPKVAGALMYSTRDSLEPFERYLKNAIDSMEKKQVSARWQRVNEQVIELHTSFQFYKVTPYTCLELSIEKGWYHLHPTNVIPENFSPGSEIYLMESQIKQILPSSNIKKEENRYYVKLDTEDKNIGQVFWGFMVWQAQPVWLELDKINTISQNNQYFKILHQEQNRITVTGKVQANTPLLVNNSNCSFQIVENFVVSNLREAKILKEKEDFFIIASKNALINQGKYVEAEKNYYNYIDLDSLRFVDNSQRFDCLLAQKSSLSFNTENNGDYVGRELISAEGITFEIRECERNIEERYWIRLLEMEEDTEEDAAAISPLEYFFDDDIEIYDNCKISYEIYRKREDDEGKKIILKSVDSKKYTLPKGDTLKVKVNTHNLKMQQKAIQTLYNMPLPEQRNLIRLFEKKELVNWKTFNREVVDEWRVLTDATRSGAIKQREFVKKALATPDFAILEGPPGSGKTTVILELIYQITKKKQRILLCGSTHVAIDNVLERLEPCGILPQVLPIRIGQEWRIRSDYIRDNFQLDYVVKNYDVPERLLLESANLVCGTTIGILQHPFIKERDPFVTPAVANFDYLIIDECSKTTFQEFLVPALYAKKWILVGDPHQLSPYTEREHIVANFKNIKGVSPYLQKACFYLHLLITNSCRYIIPCNKSVILELLNEIPLREDKNIYEKNIYFIGNFVESSKGKANNKIIAPSKIKKYRLEMVSADWIFVDEDILNTIMEDLPENLILFGFKDWFYTEHAYRHNAKFKNSYKIKKKNNEIYDNFEIAESINDTLQEKSWAEEITWRLVRKYELRLTKKDVSFLQRTIEDFLPKTISIEKEIQSVEDISLPSIIEGLQSPESQRKGIKGKREQETTITEGFSESEKKSRHIILAYQHRMHPEISDIPRQLFYTHQEEIALLDAKEPKTMEQIRTWNYSEYTKRRIWINVSGKTVRNYNEDEVAAMKKELQKFCKWATKNPEKKVWEIACLTFYRGQETKLRDMLRLFCNQPNKYSQFSKDNMVIKLYTVDKFQGQEADIVYLSMVQTYRDGFLDSPNRLNVAITRARYQLVILGKHDYYCNYSRSEVLQSVAQQTVVYGGD